MITAQMVKELRETTGAGMMDCKKALAQADGDSQKAVEILREKGLASAAKKSGRIASEGLIKTYVSEDKKTAAIVEVNCETDFVSANEDFVALTDCVAKAAAYTSATSIEGFVEEKCCECSNKSLKESLTDLIAKLGENMNIRRFERFEASDGLVGSYIHGGGRIGVLVKLSCSVVNEKVEELAKDIAMHVAAANPLFLNPSEVDNDTLNKEREIYRVQALNEGKPEKIVDKMVDGRIQKYYKEVCLTEQLWVKDQDYSIAKLLSEKSKEIGTPISVVKFTRFERGEGIQKKEENFAEEVQKQMQQGK